jgi:Cu/Ag efflux protein CusF
MAISTSPLALALALILVTSAGVATACDGDKALPAADAVYDTRGTLRSLPGSGDLPDKVMIHHEALPSFKNAAGTVVGMESMAMAFTPADGLSLAGLAAGDDVAITFEVRWNADPLLRLTRIAKLPPGTSLELNDAVH